MISARNLLFAQEWQCLNKVLEGAAVALPCLQVREDVTRYRYGDEQHLEDSLARIFLFNRPKGIPRRSVRQCLQAPDGLMLPDMEYCPEV